MLRTIKLRFTLLAFIFIGSWGCANTDQHAAYNSSPPRSNHELIMLDGSRFSESNLNYKMYYDVKPDSNKAQVDLIKPPKLVVQSSDTAKPSIKVAKFENNEIIVNEDFERVWWKTAAALEQAGLGVVDKNFSNGEYYVLPLVSQIENKDPGAFARFFGADKKSQAAQTPAPIYTIKLFTQSDRTIIKFLAYDQKTEIKDFTVKQNQYLQALSNQLNNP